jgi:hypothetical protein
MSVEQASGTDYQGDFLVRPDGTVAGDDGASGALAAALPYAGRLARRMGELVEAGDLRMVQAFGARLLTIGVTWTPADEGTFRATTTPLEPRTDPAVVVGGADTPLAVAHCVSRLRSLEGIVWSSVVTADSRVVAAAGERLDLQHLAEVGNRMLAVLRSLEDQHTNGFVKLRYEGGAMVGASLGRHALVALATSAEDVALVSVIDEIRTILAGHDLAAVTTVLDPDADGRAPVPAPATVPPPVGARFGRSPKVEGGPGRRRFGSR